MFPWIFKWKASSDNHLENVLCQWRLQAVKFAAGKIKAAEVQNQHVNSFLQIQTPKASVNRYLLTREVFCTAENPAHGLCSQLLQVVVSELSSFEWTGEEIPPQCSHLLQWPGRVAGWCFLAVWSCLSQDMLLFSGLAFIISDGIAGEGSVGLASCLTNSSGV